MQSGYRPKRCVQNATVGNDWNAQGVAVDLIGFGAVTCSIRKDRWPLMRHGFAHSHFFADGELEK